MVKKGKGSDEDKGKEGIGRRVGRGEMRMEGSEGESRFGHVR